MRVERGWIRGCTWPVGLDTWGEGWRVEGAKMWCTDTQSVSCWSTLHRTRIDQSGLLPRKRYRDLEGHLTTRAVGPQREDRGVLSRPFLFLPRGRTFSIRARSGWLVFMTRSNVTQFVRQLLVLNRMSPHIRAIYYQMKGFLALSI